MRSIRIFVGHVFECYSCMTRWKPIPLSIDFVFPSSSYSDVDLRQYRRFVAEASGRISIEQYSGIKAAYTLHASTHNVWWSIAIPTATYQFICMLRDQIRLLVIFFFLFFWLPSSRCFSCAHHFFLICCCCCGRRYLTVARLCQAGHLSDVLQMSDRLSGNWTSLWDANFLRMTPIMTPFSRSMRLPCNVRLSMRFGVLLRLHHRFITITLHSRFSYVSFFRIDRHPNKSFEQINHPPNTHISLVCDVRAPSLAPKQINSMLNCRFLRFCSHNEIRHSYKRYVGCNFFRVYCANVDGWLAQHSFMAHTQ